MRFRLMQGLQVPGANTETWNSVMYELLLEGLPSAPMNYHAMHARCISESTFLYWLVWQPHRARQQ